MLSNVAAGLMWVFMYYPSIGAMDTLTRNIGLGDVEFLASPHLALFSVLVAFLWQGVGAMMIIFLAGLQSIPPELNEAAEVNGALGLADGLVRDHPVAAGEFHRGWVPGSDRLPQRLQHHLRHDSRRAGRLHPGPRDTHILRQFPVRRVRTGVGRGRGAGDHRPAPWPDVHSKGGTQ